MLSQRNEWDNFFIIVSDSPGLLLIETKNSGFLRLPLWNKFEVATRMLDQRENELQSADCKKSQNYREKLPETVVIVSFLLSENLGNGLEREVKTSRNVT